MGHEQGECTRDFNDMVAVGYCVERVRRKRGKTEFLRDRRAVKGERACGESARTERHYVEAFERVGQTVGVPGKRPAPGAEVMRQGYRLCPLQMGVARHEGFRVFGSDGSKCLDERGDRETKFGNDPLEKKAFIQCNLVVPAPSGMELASPVTKPVSEHTLDEGMDILGAGIDTQRTRFELGRNFFKLADYCRRFVFRNDAGLAEHTGMRDASPHIVECDAGVHMNRCFKCDRFFRRAFREPSVPERCLFFCHYSFS
ncbi:MAG: hypothetical protein BWY20_02417 [Spirochaetes bacterium ADurb.Bin215]|nr:MAG: hypothetical protein BWY20_02417 [Spirochaetes bacterium ADurb.Bin215]